MCVCVGVCMRVHARLGRGNFVCTSRNSQQQVLRIQKLSQQGTESSPWRDGYSERQHMPALHPGLPGSGSVVLGG